GPAALERLRRVEDREALPDHLGRRIALQAARPLVPAHDAAFGVEHEDRVVLHAVHQQPEALLALPQPLLVLAPLREVARDLREAHELPVVAVDRGDDDVGPEIRAVLAHAPAFVLEAPEPRGGLELVLGPALLD